MNIWAVSLVRYPGQFLKWTKEELRNNGREDKEIDDYAKVDSERLYVSRKERGRRLAIIEDRVDALLKNLEECIEWKKN